MLAVTFDTLEFVESLKESGFNEEQAKGMSSAIKKVQQANLGELVTKRDLREEVKDLELRLTIRMGGMLAVTIGILIGSFFAIIRMVVPG